MNREDRIEIEDIAMRQNRGIITDEEAVNKAISLLLDKNKGMSEEVGRYIEVCSHMDYDLKVAVKAAVREHEVGYMKLWIEILKAIREEEI